MRSSVPVSCAFATFLSVLVGNQVSAQPTPRAPSPTSQDRPAFAEFDVDKAEPPKSGISGELLRLRQQLHEMQTNPDRPRGSNADEEQLRQNLLAVRLGCVRVYDPHSVASASCFSDPNAKLHPLKLVSSDCDANGDFKISLPPGNYFVETDYWHGRVDVRPGGWTKIPSSGPMSDCYSDQDCPRGSTCLSAETDRRYCSNVALKNYGAPNGNDSGVTGVVGDWTPHSGALRAFPTYLPCAKAFIPGYSVPVGCAVCDVERGHYAISLPPGKYIVEFPGVYRQTIEKMFVEVQPGKWTRLDDLSAATRSIEYPYLDGRGD